MDKLRAIEVFIEVAQGLSFSGAADRLGMARGNVTKYVAWLEKSMGVQLLTRSTKSVSLTESGRSLLDNGRELLDRVEAIDNVVRQSVRTPKGLLRLGAPPSFGAHHLVPIIRAFSQAHPDIQVILYLDDGRTDLVAEGLDMSMRIATALKDTSQIAHRLAVVPQWLVASPSYLAKRGEPTEVGDLAQHDCMVHSLKSPTNIWSFSGPDGRVNVRVRGSIRANYGEPLRHAALLGQGISMHPTYMVMQDVQAGRLKNILVNFKPADVDIHAVFPSRRNLPVRVRTFLDFLKVWFQAPDWHAFQKDPQAL